MPSVSNTHIYFAHTSTSSVSCQLYPSCRLQRQDSEGKLIIFLFTSEGWRLCVYCGSHEYMSDPLSSGESIRYVVDPIRTHTASHVDFGQ